MTKLTKLTTAEKRAAAEKKKLVAKGRAAIAVVLRKKRDVENAFYAMGRALAVLRDAAVYHALGHSSFEALCETSLGISDSQAGRLIAITEHFGAREAKKLITSSRATAIIDLANALGGHTTPKGLLARGTVTLPSGHRIDVHAADAHAIEQAAHAVRARRAPSGRGGLVISPEAREFFSRLHAALRRAKLAARVDEIAASERLGAKMRIVAGVHDARALAGALRAAAG